MQLKYSKILILLGLVFVSGSFSQDMNSYNDMWLINIPTPYTLNRRSIEMDIFGRYTNYRDTRSGVRELLLIGNYGLTNNVSLSFLTPISDLDNKLSDLQVSDISLMLKYRVFDTRFSSIAISPVISFPTGSEQKLLGSGKVNYQLRFSYGYQQKRISLFANLDYGKRGYVNHKRRLNPSGSTSIIYSMRHEQIFTFSGGLTFAVKPEVTILLEATSQFVPEFSDKDFYFQIGGILHIKKIILFRGGGGIGLPQNRKSMIVSRFLVGFSYFYN